MQFATIEDALIDIQDGKIVIIVDDEDRENEGDLMVAAEKVTPEVDQFHGHARPRSDLPGDDRTASRRSQHSADGFRHSQHVAARHGVLRFDRSAARRVDRNFRLTIARRRFSPRSIPRRSPAI